MKLHPENTKLKPRVVIQWSPNGDHAVYADADVTVYSLCEHTPDDRLYQYTPGPIPENGLDEEAGYSGDGSRAEKRLLEALVK